MPSLLAVTTPGGKENADACVLNTNEALSALKGVKLTRNANVSKAATRVSRAGL